MIACAGDELSLGLEIQHTILSLEYEPDLLRELKVVVGSLAHASHVHARIVYLMGGRPTGRNSPMFFYKRKLNKKDGEVDMLVQRSGNIDILRRADSDAFLDGVGTLVELIPDPRPRTIRAFTRHRTSRASSLENALLQDWLMVGRDMWAAIQTHEHEDTKEASTEAESFTIR